MEYGKGASPLKWRWIAVVGLVLAILLFLWARPVDREEPDPQLGYTPQGDVHAMLLAERLFNDLTTVFTSPDTSMEQLPPYPGSHDDLAGVLEYYRANLADLRDGRLCLSGAGCPERDRIILRGLVGLLGQATRLQDMEEDAALDDTTLRIFRAEVMETHAETLNALGDTLTGDGGEVFRQGSLLTRMNAIATRAGANDTEEDRRSQAMAVLEEAMEKTHRLGLDGGPGGELSRSVVRLRGSEMLEAGTVEPTQVLDLMAHMFGSLLPVAGDHDIELDLLDEYLLSNYSGIASSLRWTLIRQLDPPPAREQG